MTTVEELRTDPQFKRPERQLGQARYFAVADPDSSSAMTFWRRDESGELRPHPPRKRYGPTPPAGSRGIRRQIWDLYHRGPWLARVRAAIDADPEAAALAFASLTNCCRVCGRTLTDPESRERGIGPDCLTKRRHQ